VPSGASVEQRAPGACCPIGNGASLRIWLCVCAQWILLLWRGSTGDALAAGASAITTNNAGSLILAGQFGDLDNDGRITVLDIVRLTQHISGARLLDQEATARADLNQDGLVSERDRAVLADLILGVETSSGEDWDRDGISNAEEIGRGTNPFLADSDGDGAEDGVEIAEGADPSDAQSRPDVIVMANPGITVVSLAAPGNPITIASPSLIVAFQGGPDEASLTIAQPPVLITLPTIGIDARVVLAYPPVTVVFPGGADEAPVSLAQPPIEVHSGVP
jgi:hypothetical protein